MSVALPGFYVNLGRAMHALQDGFTHTYRNADRTRVTVVLNYIDVVNGTSTPARDGPTHSMELDQCDGLDDLRTRNRELAVAASTQLLGVALDPASSREQKVSALDVVLDRYLTPEPGCTGANGWCSAPEATLPSARGCGCGAGDGLGGLLVLAGVLLWLRRGQGAACLCALLVCLAVPATARAEGAAEVVASPPISSPEAAAAGAVVPITPAEVRAVQKEQKHQSFFSIYGGGSGAFYNAGISGALGLRFRLSDNWMLGVDAELNGWYGIHSQRMRTGATSVYASLIVRFPLKFEQVNLRSSLHLGIAIQMFDLAGVPRGSTGLFAGLDPLGIEFKLSGHFFLIFYPLGVAIPATQLNGAPFAYPQFRSTLGLEVSF